MQRVILATTKPLIYGEEQLSKNASSLKKVAKRKSLPLVLEHDGPKVGTVTDLAYEVKNGIGYLFGSIADFMGKVGSSLQYSGIRSGSEIKLTGIDHVALVDNPRDPIAVFADSDTNATRYRDSADEEPTEEQSGEGTESEPETTPDQGTEIELTDETVDQLFDLLLKDPKRVAVLKELIKGTEPEPKEEPEVEVPEEKPVEKPTRIIIKPREAKEAPVKKPPVPIQRPFKGLL
jgi:hypothetical protein